MRCRGVVLATVVTLFGLPLLSLAAQAQSDPWVSGVQTQLNAAKAYPKSAQVRGETGTVVMKITIDGNGMIMGYERVHTSGSDILDREAEKTLDKVGQFAAPADRKARTFQVSLTWEK